MLRGITISVEYDDILELTLSYNRHHFEEFLVVTSPEDAGTMKLCDRLGVTYFVTDAFYRDGALFNKWLALEEGLTHFGRHGWMAILDADIFWPTFVEHVYEVGNIYTPARYLLDDVQHTLLRESEWARLPLLKENGCPGWTQIFHATDPVLQQLPWFEAHWTHCGNGDTFFSERWPLEKNIRTAWRCLHLGPTWTNWCGRVAPRRGGEAPLEAPSRRSKLTSLLLQRRRNRNYEHEKLRPQSKEGQ